MSAISSARTLPDKKFLESYFTRLERGKGTMPGKVRRTLAQTDLRELFPCMNLDHFFIFTGGLDEMRLHSSKPLLSRLRLAGNEPLIELINVVFHRNGELLNNLPQEQTVFYNGKHCFANTNPFDLETTAVNIVALPEDVKQTIMGELNKPYDTELVKLPTEPEFVKYQTPKFQNDYRFSRNCEFLAKALEGYPVDLYQPE